LNLDEDVKPEEPVDVKPEEPVDSPDSSPAVSVEDFIK